MSPSKWVYGALKRAEKYTKTDMVYIAKGGMWLTLAQVAASLFSLPLSIAFAYFLTPQEYGVYRYALSVASVVGIFSLTGLGTAITRSVARGFGGALRQGFWINLRWSFLLVLVALIGAGYYAFRDNYALSAAMLVIAVFSPLFNSSGFFISHLNGLRDFKTASIYSTWRNLIGAAAVLTAVVLSRDPVIILAVYFISYTLTGLYFHHRTLKKHTENESPDPEMKNLSKHLSFTNGLAVLADKLDSILLFQFIGGAQVAIYAFAEIVPDLINRLTKNIIPLALPKFANRDRSEHGDLFQKAFLFNLAFLPLVVIYIFAAPYLFALFWPTYMESVLFSQVLAFLVLFNGMIPTTFIESQGAVREKYIITLVGSGTRIVFVIIGVLLYGIWGAVFARFITKIVGFFTLYVLLRGMKSKTS